MAQERCRRAGGSLVLRNEDLDRARCRPEFVDGMLEDLAWFGFQWQEGPDIGGPFQPYSQSERYAHYTRALEKLCQAGFVYPCACSRQDVLRALGAPHAGEDEPVYPGTCRTAAQIAATFKTLPASARVNWRFRVPDGEEIHFEDGGCGPQRLVAGKDFGDFVVWRHDGIPAYQLAVVVDDAAMGIAEVVRGEDLLRSTARQLLLYRALELQPPAFFHCALVKDVEGRRLAKRHDSLSLRALRSRGISPEQIRSAWEGESFPRFECGEKN
jgi:glutamyl-tRNA synthetase